MTTIAGPSTPSSAHATTPAALSARIRSLAAPVYTSRVEAEVKAYLDAAYPDLASLTGAAPAQVEKKHRRGGGGSYSASSSRPSTPVQAAKKRTLDEDIAHWTSAAASAGQRLADAEAALPGAIGQARAALESLQTAAQDLALERYRQSDESAALLAQLSSSAPLDDDEEGGERAPTLLEQVEGMEAGLGRTRAALAWSRVLERILRLRDAVLDPAHHTPSALAALPHYRALSDAIVAVEKVLPPGMALLGTLADVRADAWAQLKRVLSDTLLAAAEPLGWPRRVDYASVPADKRRAFERAYSELLHLQAEGESLHATLERSPSWTSGDGLYPIQALTEPITLRFKYHFQGSRSTNRVDKPEWAFANIQDAVYEHAGFIADYLQPLTAREYPKVDVTCELTMLLFPTLLAFLRTRIPHLLSHPALLAHTVYQTVMFDDAVRENGFELARTSVYAGAEAEWEGLAGVILREHDWFEQWLEGERKFAETSLNDIISAPNAWAIAVDEDEDEDDGEAALPSTESARKVKALIEGITDRYAPLPAQEYRVAFLRTIQLPTLAAYHSRLDGSLNAFETLSSAFVRAVPGALGGARPTPDSRVTVGTAGLERLIKAHVSAEYLVAALRSWSNDVLFAEMSADLAGDAAAPSVWDPTAQRYSDLRARAEDMMVRLITSEVESDLKQHLTRRWDVGADGALEDSGPDSSLVAALAGYTSLLSALRVLPRTPAARVYRRVSAHLVNHIAQRAVYAGWSKFTAAGGRALLSEVDDWRHAAAAGVARITPPIPTDVPWNRLYEMATLLALPSESEAEADTPTFAQAMAAAWSGGAALDSLRERTGVHELSEDELQAVLRRRLECWR
ncbi:RAD50-interacting protein 1 [Vanrija pseudolonga]|uniref:RAD50-interacting protein 1 n=1 Tax=Vanrija pseudolonga TaxID=143232 RepID=A0AAF0YJR3_9TREE|nr:RAD50-interacting protein 1 [Vanrija pseudolonga]